MTSPHLPWSEYAAYFAEVRRVLSTGGWYFRYGFAPGTTDRGAVKIEEFTYNELPEHFPGVGPVCIPERNDLVTRLTSAGLAPIAERYLSREYGRGQIVRYGVLESTAR